MSDPLERPVVKPLEDDPGDPPIPEGEPSRTAEEEARGDLAIRAIAQAGGLGSPAGYAGGAATGTGGAVGMRQVQAEENAERAAADDAPEETGSESRNLGQSDT